MELDLDSFLQSQTSSEDEEDNNPKLYHQRTIEEILNDSDSDTDSPSPSSNLKPFTEKPSQDSNFTPNSTISSTPISSEVAAESKISSRKAFLLGRSALFGGVRVNAKPGAALAAAAAASRSIPTPHAAAIKWRRANSDAALEKNVQGEVLDLDGKLDSKVGEFGEKNEIFKTPIQEFDVVNQHVEEEGSKVDGIELGTEEDSKFEGQTTLHHGNNDDENVDRRNDSLSDVIEENAEAIGASENDNELNLSSTSPVSLDENRGLPENGEDVEVEEDSAVIESEWNNDEEVSEVNVNVNEVAEDRGVELDVTKGEERGKILRSSMKPLELAEELEKKHAYSGLHWEEGAAAQPMRLEGIRRGPPAVGYLDINTNNVITRTISSPAFKREHGSPKVLAVHANFIAVGMSKGLTLVVPSKYSAQNADKMDAKMLLLAPQSDRSHFPVTSMCFNQQGDLLLAGYGNGHVIVWDMQRAAMAKVITGEHTAPVVHTLFLGRQFKAVTGDCKGLALLHTFSIVPLLNRLSVKTQCLLDGQKTGILLSASPLLMEDSGSLTSTPGSVATSSGGIGSMMGGVVGGSLFNEGSSVVDEGVVVFATHHNALVARLSPNLEVYAQFSKPDGVRDGSMPYTAWKSTSLSKGSSTESTAGESSERASLLVIAWDRKVQVSKLVKSELKVYKEWTLDSAAIGVAWLDDQMLAILTLRRQFCLFSKEGNELHRTNFPLDISGADDFIVNHTYFSNLFGNPEKAYHNCLAVRGATIYVLGPMHLLVSRLLPWKERIQVLRTAGDWMGALDMAMRLYDGHAHGVIDLPRTLDAIREAIMAYLVELILSYVDEVFSYISVASCSQIEREEQGQNSESKTHSVHSEMEDQFARVGGVAVEFCVHVKRVDVLFDDIFSKFVAVHHGGTFLELLEPYILKDMLGCLPPEIMQALVEHYSSKGWLQRVEQCVLHMDISSLDFNQVVRLCREHGLYGALIYLFNKGLDDFKAPLEELLLVFQSSQEQNAATIAYRMLVYLKYCFSGLAFPPGHGVLSAHRLPSLRRELVQFLLEKSNQRNPEVTASFEQQTGVYPNLFHLLRFDTEATLEVLRLAFPEDSNSDTGAKSLSDEKENAEDTEDLNVIIQETVNTLVLILDMRNSDENETSGTFDLEVKNIWPSKKDTCHLLEFIAHFVACKRATVTKSVLNHILEFLTTEDRSNQKIEESKRREKQMLTILTVVSDTDWNSTYVLHICEKAHYYQVCGYIHTKRCEYVAALDSYIKDLDEPIHAFSFINSMFLRLRDAEFATFQSAVISRIPELVNLSREDTFLLIYDHFNKESENILSELRSNPKSLFLYLKATIEVHLSGTLKFSSLEKGYVMDLQSGSQLKDQPNEVELYIEKISDFPRLVLQNPVHITDDVIELYVELLCQFERNSVLKFLQTFDNYRLERCLRLCQEYRVIDAAAFLLERVGDVGSALSLTLSGLNEKFHKLDLAVENILLDVSMRSSSELQLYNSVLNIEEVNAVRGILHSSIGICQRNSKRLDPEESEILWFQLLDSFCEPLRDPNDDKVVYNGNIPGMLAATFDVKEDKEASIDRWRIPKSHRGANILRKLLAQFIKEIVEGMIGGYVRLPTIMSKLLSDNGSQVFGDFKLIIMGMLGSYGFEKRILDTAKSLIEDDTFYTMSLLKKGASHGYAPQNLICQICGCLLSKESSTSGIRVFECGHTTHVNCEIQENGLSNGHAAGCPVCVPKKKTRGSRNNSATTEHRLIANPSSRPKQSQGTSIPQHIHESDLLERPYGVQQISRFEVLSNLKKSQRSILVESLPQLRLAPPAVYHEKIQKGNSIMIGESSKYRTKTEKPNKQIKELKMKKSALRFPLKSSIFGNETTRKR